jgi:hypothetical protein
MANQYTKRKENNRREIIWNLVNAGLAGLLVFAGACADGNIGLRGVIAALIAGGIVAITKFKGYWEKEETEYCSTKLFNFVKF